MPKIDELRALSEADNPVESWLSDDISDNEIAIDGYEVFRVDRNHQGGGVLMYVHCSLSVKVLTSGFNGLELLIVTPSQHNSLNINKCCIGLFYHPPSSTHGIFDDFCTVLHGLDIFYA